MFKINHDEAGQGFELIEKGDYEVTVINYQMGQSTNGNNVIKVDYEIRSDVPQKHQGQKILYDNFTITENAMWRLQAIAKAAGFPNGMTFNSYKEWADTLLNKTLVVNVGHREYNGNTYPEVKGFKESQADAPAQDTPPVQVGDSDLPF